MHFSIPETESRSGDSGGPAYVAYNIHVNGVLHCRVRYSQLLGLHEQLRKEYGANVLPAFPPKKLFSLTPAEVEQRREQLEKYMQAVRQDPLLGSSETFNSFLRRAQQETQQVPTEEVSLEVLLSNGQKVLVNVLTSDQTEDVLEVRHFFCTGLPSPVPPALLPRLKMIGTTPFEDLYFLPCPQAVAAKLDLPDDLIGYFSLFLVREKEDGAFSCEFLWTLQLPSVSSSKFASLSPPRMWQAFPQGFPSCFPSSES